MTATASAPFSGFAASAALTIILSAVSSLPTVSIPLLSTVVFWLWFPTTVQASSGRVPVSFFTVAVNCWVLPCKTSTASGVTNSVISSGFWFSSGATGS